MMLPNDSALILAAIQWTTDHPGADLPYRRYAILAEMRAADAAHASEIAAASALAAEEREAYVKRSKRNRRWAVVSGEGTAVAVQGSSVALLERRASALLRAAGEDTWSRTNAEKRGEKLPRMAASMAGSRGRVPGADVAEQFVSSFRSQWASVERLAQGFLPEKIAHKDGREILMSALSGLVPCSAPKGAAPTAAQFSALMRSVNPGSGRAGGRPRKVRDLSGQLGPFSPAGGNGVLSGSYDPGLVGMMVGGLPQKVDGCTCAGLSGSGYRGCAGHGYRPSAGRPFVGRKLADGTVVHTGDLGCDDTDTGGEAPES